MSLKKFVSHKEAQKCFFVAHRFSGGDDRIRTCEGLLTLNGLANRRLQPLGHISVPQNRRKPILVARRRLSRLQVFGKPGSNLAKHLRCVRIRRFHEPVVAPSSVAARCDETRAPQVREVTRNLWLIYLESFDTRTDAYFVVADQVNETQSGVVAKGFEKGFNVDFLLTHSSAVTTIQRKSQFLERLVFGEPKF